MFNVYRSQSFNVKCLQKSKRKKILPPDARLPAFLTCLANLMTAHLQVNQDYDEDREGQWT